MAKRSIWRAALVPQYSFKHEAAALCDAARCNIRLNRLLERVRFPVGIDAFDGRLWLPHACACRPAHRVAGMRFHVRVEEATNHPLVLRISSRRCRLEEVNALLAERDGDFDIFIPECQFSGRWKEVANDLGLPHRFIRVFDFRAHK
jgi:hypothetical protein